MGDPSYIDTELKRQDEKFLSMYPDLAGMKANKIIQKRLNKNVKYFDSGDYNVAKDKALKLKQKLTEPEAVEPVEVVNRPEIQDVTSSQLGFLNSDILEVDQVITEDINIDPKKAQEVLKDCTGNTIPTPENIPSVVRKKSLLSQPSSSLSRSESHSFDNDAVLEANPQ